MKEQRWRSSDRGAAMKDGARGETGMYTASTHTQRSPAHFSLWWSVRGNLSVDVVPIYARALIWAPLGAKLPTRSNGVSIRSRCRVTAEAMHSTAPPLQRLQRGTATQRGLQLLHCHPLSLYIATVPLLPDCPSTAGLLPPSIVPAVPIYCL